MRDDLKDIATNLQINSATTETESLCYFGSADHQSQCKLVRENTCGKTRINVKEDYLKQVIKPVQQSEYL